MKLDSEFQRLLGKGSSWGGCGIGSGGFQFFCKALPGQLSSVVTIGSRLLCFVGTNVQLVCDKSLKLINL